MPDLSKMKDIFKNDTNSEKTTPGANQVGKTKNTRRDIILGIIIFILVTGYGYYKTYVLDPQQRAANGSAVTVETGASLVGTNETETSITASVPPAESAALPETIQTSAPVNSTSLSQTTLGELVALEYSGEPAVAVNDNQPYFTEDDFDAVIVDWDENGPVVISYEKYSDLDSLGRCGYAMACIGKDLMPADDEQRGSISNIKPSGWVQNQYPDLIERSNGYLYERCHLIAWSLAGENANEKNLITGTGYFNVDAMYQVCEEPVLSYLKANPDNHVLYRVTPVYSGNDLVARGVLIEAYSVEDNGTGICFCYYCFNVQPGITIDYATGENEETWEN